MVVVEDDDNGEVIEDGEDDGDAMEAAAAEDATADER